MQLRTENPNSVKVLAKSATFEMINVIKIKIRKANSSIERDEEGVPSLLAVVQVGRNVVQIGRKCAA